MAPENTTMSLPLHISSWENQIVLSPSHAPVRRDFSPIHGPRRCPSTDDLQSKGLQPATKWVVPCRCFFAIVVSWLFLEIYGTQFSLCYYTGHSRNIVNTGLCKYWTNLWNIILWRFICWSTSELPHQLKLLGWTGRCMQRSRVRILVSTIK